MISWPLSTWLFNFNILLIWEAYCKYKSCSLQKQSKPLSPPQERGMLPKLMCPWALHGHKIPREVSPCAWVFPLVCLEPSCICLAFSFTALVHTHLLGPLLCKLLPLFMDCSLCTLRNTQESRKQIYSTTECMEQMLQVVVSLGTKNQTLMFLFLALVIKLVFL